jgi:hypothetical protein
LPNDHIVELINDVVSYYSGPDDGICDVSLVLSRKIQHQKTTQESRFQTNSADKEKADATVPQQQEQAQEQHEQQQEKEKAQQIQNGNYNSQPHQQHEQQVHQHQTIPLLQLDPQLDDKQRERQLISECWDSFAKCDLNKWNQYHHKSYGIACSLYENNLVNNTTVGDPIADVYAILTRRNSSILLLADGVNWGPRSRLAARCAVRAAMNYLNRNLFCSNSSSGAPAPTCNGNALTVNAKNLTTHDLFKLMMRSFDAAQEYILQKKGTMTTLCCSVVAKLRDSSSNNGISASLSANPLVPNTWVVCTLSIGDSTAYVFNKEKGVFECTYGARNLNDDRDMRNVGGALGHVYGNKPDVSNLNYSLMYIKENDIVFLVSDG